MKKNILKKAQKGQSLVEMAISLIVILFLLMGAVEFGIALFQFTAIRDAAQEGAVYGSTNPSNESQIKQRAIAAADDIVTLVPNDITVTINGDDCEGMTNGTPHSLTVSITYAHTVFMPLIPQAIGSNTINLNVDVTNTILSPLC